MQGVEPRTNYKRKKKESVTFDPSAESTTSHPSSSTVA
jgi:hypothetical protein